MPYVATHPEAAAQSTSAGKRIRVLANHQGKLYAGYGDTAQNTGPIAVRYWDPVTAAWSAVLLSQETEAIWNMRPTSIGLISPSADLRAGNTVASRSDSAHALTIFGAPGSILATQGGDSFDQSGVAALGTSSTGHAWTIHIAGWERDGLGNARVNTISPVPQATIDAGVADANIYYQYSSLGSAAKGSMVRWVDAANFIYVDDAGIWKMDGGVFSQLSVHSNWAPSTGIVLIRIEGTSIQVFSGDPLERFSNYTFTTAEQTKYGAATRHGIRSNSLDTRLTAFEVRALGAVPGNHPAVHVYDAAERVSGERYLCGEAHDTGPSIWRNNGTSGAYQVVKTHDHPGRRFYSMGVLGSTLVAVVGGGEGLGASFVFDNDAGEQCYKFDGTTWTRGPVLNGFHQAKEFGGTLLYRGDDDMLRGFNGTSVTTYRSAKLHAVSATEVWVVDGTSVYSTTNLSTWTLRGGAPSNATSMALT